MQNRYKINLFFLLLFFAFISCTDEEPNSLQVSTVFIDNVTQKISIGKVSFLMKYVECGTFYMGAQKDDPNGINYDENAFEQESPVHSVTLTKDYWIGVTEVTQELWQAVMGTDELNPGRILSSQQQPVNYVTWEEAYMFTQKISSITGKHFRLPTEAEWEYAARGGKYSKNYKYSGSNNLDEVACYLHSSDSNFKVKPYEFIPDIVATYKPNELGLYDMSGNVWEYCNDYLRTYTEDPVIDPVYPIRMDKVIRGGSFLNAESGGCLRVSARFWVSAVKNIDFNMGFRLVLDDNK